jgi:hypothetical protein
MQVVFYSYQRTKENADATILFSQTKMDNKVVALRWISILLDHLKVLNKQKA